MAIAGIDPKCYILALFVRDDGVRFLLGDDPYEFKDKQLHFQPNTVANDVVEVQGNDGYLLAGQVRRPGTQSFDGYVCNGTNSKAEVEVKRREFLQFFRRSHFYKVIYVFPNGTAIQRKQGFLVDDPTVQELYQQYPEYHVALNFEDVNYYTYEEDDQGQEIYAKEAIVPLAGGGATGGLIWDEYGVVWEDPWSDLVSVSGSEMQIENEAGARAPIQDLELQGDTFQQTYSGKNLVPFPYEAGGNQNGITATVNSDGTVILNGQNNGNANTSFRLYYNASTPLTLEAGTYYFIPPSNTSVGFSSYDGSRYYDFEASNGYTQTFSSAVNLRSLYIQVRKGDTTVFNNYKVYPMLSTLPDQTEADYEPYVGGIPAPNPDYPQDVQTVTGEQTVEVSGDGGQSSTYEINLGGNLFDKTDVKQGYRIGAGGDEIVGASYSLSNYIQIKPSATYTLSRSGTSGQFAAIAFYDSSETFISRTLWDSTSAETMNLASPNNAVYIRITDLTNIIDTVSLQRTPIVSQIELCKIGDYQDEIFNNDPNEDWYNPDLEDNAWYVHKEVGTNQVDVSSGVLKDYANVDYFSISKPNDYAGRGSYNYYPILCTHAVVWKEPTGGWNSADGIGKAWTGAERTQLWIGFTNGTTLETMQSMLSVAKLYYQIANPTDTQITDATLIGQLEALGAMRLFIGENNLLVSATGTNLPATLEFSYPTKFANIGAEWEEGGTKGATIVDVNAIDNTYPVWELMGPAVNPTLSVLTTNTTLTYNGTITASQKLVIDMFNKTATLNGTSVIGNVSGDFVYMAPGTNRIAYTAGNTDAPDSTIYWQEVVG